MTFTWEEFSDVAEWLPEERSDEASRRTAINRAYYAAYHAAAAYVRAEEPAPASQQLRHDQVWRLIRDSKRPKCGIIAQLSFNLRDARVKADYKNPYPGNLDRETNDAIAFCASIVSLLREAHAATAS